MSSNTTEAQLPNPFTPMSFFPASLAFSITVSSYVTVGTLSIMLWDILNNMRDEYTLLTRYKINFPAIVYYISRLSHLISFIMQALFQTLPLGNCERTWKIVSYLTAITIPSTSLLFFFRLRAVYRENRVVIAFFLLLWLCVLGASSMVIFGTSAENIGSTNYCIDGSIKQYVSFGAATVIVHDTLIFFAISWRLMGISFGEKRSFIDVLKNMILGRSLPAFSRAFLKDGQVYYLITIGFGIITTVVLYMDTIPLVYRGMLGNPNLMLMNVLACRVYRNTKLGRYQESPATIISNAAQDLKHMATTDKSMQSEMVVEDLGGGSTPGVTRASQFGESFWVDELGNERYGTSDQRYRSPLRMV